MHPQEAAPAAQSADSGGQPEPVTSRPARKGSRPVLRTGGKGAPVEVLHQPKKKAGKDMTATELEWEKKAINASIAGAVSRVRATRKKTVMIALSCVFAGDVRHLASEKAALVRGELNEIPDFTLRAKHSLTFDARAAALWLGGV